MRVIWPFVRAQWKLGIVIVLLSCLLSAIGCLLPFSGKIVIDFILERKGIDSLGPWLQKFGLENQAPFFREFLLSSGQFIPILLCLALITLILGFIQNILAFRLEQKFAFNLQMTLFERVLRFPFSFFSKISSSYLANRIMGDVEGTRFSVYVGASLLFSHFFRVFWGIVFLFSLSGKLSVLFFLAIPFYVAVNIFFANRIRGICRNEQEKEARVGEAIQESFSGIETVKSFNANDRQVNRLSSALKLTIHARGGEMVLNLAAHYTERAFQAVFALLILGMGIMEVSRGTLSTGDLVAFFSFLAVVVNSISGLLQIHISVQPWMASMERLLKLLNKSAEFPRRNIKLTPRAGGLAPEFNNEDAFHEIVFSDVFFSYRDNEPVLKNFSFKAGKGEITLLMGPSGVGKTTIAKLILKFFKPGSGKILLSGKNLEEIDSFNYRQAVSYVSQDVFLFRDTIANNLRVAKPEATEPELEKACRLAQIHDEILSFSNGYETIIGERGTNLSLGQRQRISIARAILKKSSIYIFDEPTSSLDNSTEKALFSSLKPILKNGIAIVISHKPSLKETADKIISLER